VLVVLTGYGQEADRRTSIRAGFNYHLVKPTDFKRVKTILAAFLLIAREAQASTLETVEVHLRAVSPPR